MIQELSLSVMLKGAATGSEGVDTAVRAEIDGITLRELLLKGQEAKRQRLDLEKTRLEVCIDANSRRRTRPGDTASADYLDHFREQQSARLATVVHELGIANERLAQLGGSARPAPVVVKEHLNKPGDTARPETSEEGAEPADEAPQLLTTGGH